jgi:DNA-directed RNA polymerase specialized sigma subunit
MTTPTPDPPHGTTHARFVHLGDRLLALGRIRSGAASVDRIAEEFDVEPEEVMRWMEAHAGDRVTSLDEIRHGSEEMRTLAHRARNLMNLVEEADRRIRELHQEYLLMVAAKHRDLAKDLA